MISQKYIILRTPLEQVSSEDLISTANRLENALTLTVFSENSNKLQQLVSVLLSSHLSDICFVDQDNTTPILVSELINTITIKDVEKKRPYTITFLRLKRLVG